MHNAEECGLDMAIYIWNGPIEPKNETEFPNRTKSVCLIAMPFSRYDYENVLSDVLSSKCF